jgi:type IV secretion system protein VirB11
MPDVNSTILLKPIGHFLNDDTVSEIVLNQPGIIFVEKNGHFTEFDIPEFDIKGLARLFRLIANENHQELNETHPLLSGILPGGQRVQLVTPPVTSDYCFSIRKNKDQQITFHDLIKNNYFKQAKFFSLDKSASHLIHQEDVELVALYHRQQWDQFILKSLITKKNIVISGATSSGKTTFLNACLNEIPPEERILILEDTAEVHIKHRNSVRLLAHKGQQGLSSITMQDLVQCSLRLRPDRIIVGEVRGKELLDFIAVSLTGHSGVITTIHAENPRMALTRMCQMYKLNTLPAMTDDDIYAEIQQALDIIIQLKKSPSGRYLSDVYFKLIE